MKRFTTLSTAVLAATFSVAPLYGADSAGDRAQQAQDQAQQQAQQARERANQTAGEAKDQARQAADEVQGGEGRMNADQHFIKEAAADNQFEIQLGQFVSQQSQNDQVKQLAQQMVQDHQQAQQQLQQIAEKSNMQLATQLEPWQQEKLQAMQRHRGEMLDRNFAFGEVGAHRTDILKYQYEAEHAQNDQLKQYAQQTIPALEKHLRLAEQASEQWVPQARTAGEHQRGERSDRTGNTGTENRGYNATGAGADTNQQGTPSRTNNQGINR